MSPALPAGCRLTPAAPATLARLLSARPDVRVIFPTPGGLRIENLTLAPRGLGGVLIVSEGEGQGYQSKADAWNVEDATPATLRRRPRANLIVAAAEGGPLTRPLFGASA